MVAHGPPWSRNVKAFGTTNHVGTKLVGGICTGGYVSSTHPRYQKTVKCVRSLEKALTELSRDAKVHESATRQNKNLR